MAKRSARRMRGSGFAALLASSGGNEGIAPSYGAIATRDRRARYKIFALTFVITSIAFH